MLSGNGRHRRPRQAPAIFVTAGVTGASIAIPLLGASGAQAADAETWDRVAQCESGGMWSADTGNGYYGGLQFTQETWEEYGGRDYAPTADRASRSQQIAVAEKVLAAEGPFAWPSCAVNAGLTEEDVEEPEIDPGDTESAAPDESEESEGSGTLPELIEGDRKSVDPGSGEEPDEDGSGGAADGSADDASGDASGEEPDESDAGSEDARDEAGDGAAAGDDATAGDSAGDSAGEGTGRHRGAPADEESGDREPGRHASRDGEEARGGYTVQPGDSLSGIADSQELDGGWPALYDANESVVGDDPDLILPGQLLDLTAGGQ